MYASFFDELEKIAAATNEGAGPNWKKRLALGASAVGTATALGFGIRHGIKSRRTNRDMRRRLHDLSRRLGKAEKGVKDFKKTVNKAGAKARAKPEVVYYKKPKVVDNKDGTKDTIYAYTKSTRTSRAAARGRKTKAPHLRVIK